MMDRFSTNDFSSTRQHDEGAIAVIVAVSLIPLVLGLAVMVDSGRAWTERIALQNSVELTTAAAALAWMRTGVVCPPNVLANLTKDDSEPDSHECSTTGSRVDGTITVSARDNTPLYFASLFGRATAQLDASTTARIGSAASLEGVWPIALCESHPSLVEWRNSGFSLTTNYVITMRETTEYCGGNAGGNWGVLDFDGGSNSNTETAKWVQNGWPDSLDVGDLVAGNPGAVSNSIGIQAIFGRSVLIPLFNYASLTGSNALYRISGFARGVIIAGRLTGSSANRSLTVRFETAIVDREGAAVGGGSNSGVTNWAICAQDTTGECK